MRKLEALTPEEFERARQRLMNPPPGSRIEAAAKFGIDLTLLISQLRLSPAERATRLEEFSKAIEEVRGIARRRS